MGKQILSQSQSIIVLIYNVKRQACIFYAYSGAKILKT